MDYADAGKPERETVIFTDCRGIKWALLDSTLVIKTAEDGKKTGVCFFTASDEPIHV